MRYPLQIQQIEGIYVVRDDLIPGGTKQRVLAPLMERLSLQGYREFVYGGPAEGYAQLALAYAAQETGLQASYFVAQRTVPHRNSINAAKAGCLIHQVPFGRLNVVQARAREYAARTGAYLFPFGFSMPEFQQALSQEIIEALQGASFSEVWCVSGSGLLSRCLQQALPNARHYAIRIGTEPNIGSATLLQAPETFSEDARLPPPFPSASNYDAKAWQFIRRHASPGALFWNVGA